tara:strand:+ start:753 stop:3764 length:3012 start_codon:yes stop_codon:yes gene_type:complete
MAQTYTRQSSFADGDTITAALFNDEYNQLVNAFAYSSSSSSSTGHRHDGSAAQGGNIFKIGDLDFLNKIEADSSNNRWGFYVEVSAAAVEQIRIQDGAIVPVTDNDIDLGTSSLEFKDAFFDGTITTDALVADTADINGGTVDGATIGANSASTGAFTSVTTTGNVDVGGNLTVTGTTTFNGGTLTLGDANTDNIVFGGEVDSNIIPDDDNTYDLGSSSQEWKDLYVDGVAYLDGINFNGTAITSTAAELNILDGVTSTAAELNILDGVTSTTAELNILDGVTSTTAELNILDGVTATAAELNILDGVTSTTAELNILDGVTATAAEINALDGITSTVAELNILDGVTASAADINLIDGITNGTVIASKAIITDANKDITGGRNITISGELDAATLDISGDADIDGTLEADAITIGGVTLAETISDTVGAMVTSNTETGIAVTYDDSDNTLDFVIGTLNQDTTGNAATATALETARTIHGVSFDGTANIDLSEVIQDTVGAMVSSNTESGITVAYEDSDGTLDFTVGTLNQDTTGNAATATALETARTIHGVSFDGTANIDLTEVVQDTVGAMFSSNTETGITATYQDSDGTIDLTVTGAAVTNITDADGDTKVQVEESSDEDTIRFDTAGTERMVITSGGDIAINSPTADPLGLTFTGTGLTINEDSGTTFIQLDGGNGSRIEFGQSGSRHFSLFSDASNFTEFKRTTDHPLVFAVNSAETARFTSGALQFAAGKNITTASGDLTIDCPADIVLDADGGNIEMKDDGLHFYSISRSGDNAIIQSVISDGDVIIQGNDGGSTITALTIDMSDAGRAMFNGSIDIGGTSITRTGDLTLDGSGDLILDAGGDNIKFADSGTEIGQIDMGSQNLTFRSQIDDKDIIFRGQDGTSEIVALTLDMSEAGAATFNNNVTAFSDERLKDNIETLENGLGKVEQLRGVTYTRDDREEIGVIAQEVEKILPEIVLTADDEMGTKSVDYSRITAVLIEAVKELSARVKELENK